MGLYKANPKDGVAWVTGASTGIGREVALRLAAEGYTVAASARDEERLGTLAREAAGSAGRIVPFPCDVTDEKGMARTVATIERDIGPIVLAIFNAGNYVPTRGERLDVLNIVNTYEINFFGVFFGLVPTVAHMQARGFGHVVLVGSVSAYFGWPSAGAYGSTKAALNNIAEALKHDFDRLNIRLQVVNPGFIDTPMISKTRSMLPAVMPVERAADRFMAALKSNRFEATFPRRLTWPLKILRALPFSLRYWLIHKATGWDKKPMAKGRKPKEL